LGSYNHDSCPKLALDVEDFLARGQYHEAVLPLPYCPSSAGCRTVVTKARDKTGNPEDDYFMLPELFQLDTDDRVARPTWIEGVVAIPSSQFNEGFLKPDKVAFG